MILSEKKRITGLKKRVRAIFNKRSFRACTAFLLAFLMAFGVVSVTAVGSSAAISYPSNDSTSSNLKDNIGADKYDKYMQKFLNVDGSVKPEYRNGESFTFDALNYNAEHSTATGIYTDKFDGIDGIYLPANGRVTWDINVPNKGLYTIRITYYTVEEGNSKDTAIERSIYIGSSIPFYEAGTVSFPKNYVFDYIYKDDDGNITFDVDKSGNQLRTTPARKAGWNSVFVTESTGFYINPLEFYLDEGYTSFSMFAQREAMVVSSVEFISFVELPNYKSYIDSLKAKGISDVKLSSPIKIQAEFPLSASESTVYATTDRTDAISEPMSARIIKLNTLGGGDGSEKKWKYVGQTVRYEITVPETGFYNIAIRFNQNVLQGLFTSRTLAVATASDIAVGKEATVPFMEAYSLQFNYRNNWQVEYINSGADSYNIYLEEGRNIIQFTAALGNMAEIIRIVEDSLLNINRAYFEILKLTGANPDKNRDYNFIMKTPSAVNSFANEAVRLANIADLLVSVTGETGAQVNTLREISRLLEKMGGPKAETMIAKNLTSLKANLGTLGTWLQTAKEQPLEFDYISFYSGNTDGSKLDKLPRATANFWQSLVYEFKMFLASFYGDFNNYGQKVVVGSTGQPVEVWLTTGRDQAQIVRSLITSGFSPTYGIPINLKLVSGGTLLPSVLAGVGPDISMGHGAGDVINWAIRSAVLELTDMKGYDVETSNGPAHVYGIDEIRSWFSESAWIPLTLDVVVDGRDTDKLDKRWRADAANGWVGWNDFKNDAGEIVQGYHQKQSIYGVPMEQTFLMMFYRADIFKQLGIDPPTTWEEFNAVTSTLQQNNLDVMFPSELGGANLFTYQMYGNLYAEGGQKINLDSKTSLKAFEEMCDYFQLYRLPLVMDFANRFRTGEVPLGIVDYTMYTQLSVFATEIKGLWEFLPLPAHSIKDENDNITGYNSVVPSGASAMIMMKGAADKGEDHVKRAWAYMQWYVSKTNQKNFANEQAAILGTVSKYNTANIEALMELPWTTSEATNLLKQFNNLVGIHEYPGSYIIGRYVNFAFLAVYNDSADPADSMLKYIGDINKELTRKRQEFGLAVLDIGGNYPTN